ncbi:MAG: hypothetical protein ACLR8L_00340 [Oscillospiraceae bacterium]
METRAAEDSAAQSHDEGEKMGIGKDRRVMSAQALAASVQGAAVGCERGDLLRAARRCSGWG